MNSCDISVIITTRNEEAHIENCLGSIKSQDYPQDKIEIIVVDNNSTDKTKEIAVHFTDKVFNHGPERSAQRNFGINKADSDYVLYLDADMTLSAHVISECLEKCRAQGVDALYIPEEVQGEDFWARTRNFERSFYNATCIDAVRFVKKELALEIGGFDEALTGPEDWDFDRRINAVSRADIIRSPIYHNEEKFSFRQYLKKKKYYRQWFSQYAHKWGERDPIVRKQLGFSYRLIGVFFEKSKWTKLIFHPIYALGMYFLRGTLGLHYFFTRPADKAQGILLITPFFRPNMGGVETRLNDLCDELDKSGYEITVLTYQPITTKAKGARIERSGNITIRRFWWIGFDLFHKLQFSSILQTLYLSPILFFHSLFFLMRNHKKISVMHTAGFNAAMIGRIMKSIFKKRWVVSTHAIYDFKSGTSMASIAKWILSPVDKILTLSEPSKQELISVGIAPERIVNQITWVNQDIFKPLDRRESKQKIGHPDKFTVLFVGRLLGIKGIKDLAEVADETPDIDYLFIGDGPLSGYLEGKSQKSKNIFFLRGLDNCLLPVYYNAADIFIMPSQYKEGLGRVAVEALSCGVPVVASNLGGLAYILNDSVSVMIEPTKANIRMAIVELRDHPDKLEAMRRVSRDFAMDKFSARNFKVILEAYGLN